MLIEKDGCTAVGRIQSATRSSYLILYDHVHVLFEWTEHCIPEGYISQLVKLQCSSENKMNVLYLPNPLGLSVSSQGRFVLKCKYCCLVLQVTSATSNWIQ